MCSVTLGRDSLQPGTDYNISVSVTNFLGLQNTAQVSNAVSVWIAWQFQQRIAAWLAWLLACACKHTNGESCCRLANTST